MKIEVTDNGAAQRYEARVDGALAGFITYQIRGDRIAMLHTQVEDSYEGKGIGSSLVKNALNMVRDSGRGLLPFCPFVAGYVRRHAEYQDLVPVEERANFDLRGADEPA